MSKEEFSESFNKLSKEKRKRFYELLEKLKQSEEKQHE